MGKLTKNSPVTFLELPPTQYGILNGDLSFDEFSKSRLPSRAIDYLAAGLIANGWTDVEVINSYYNGDKGKLTQGNWRRMRDSHILGISFISRTAPLSLALAKWYKGVNPEGIAIAGGSHATFRVEESLNTVDIVVRKEGDATTPILFNRLIEDRENLEDILGIAFKKNENIFVTEDRKLLTTEELGRIPYRQYDEKTRKGVNIWTIETTRGCPNDCDFCGVTEFYGRKYRMKPIESVLGELRQIRQMSYRGTLFYVDDNFAANSKRTKDLCDRIADEKLNRGWGIAQVTVDVAKKPEVLGAMKKAGIKMLCVGIESINDDALLELGKPYSAKQNKEAVKTFREYGFWVHGMMMPGGDGDTLEIIRETSKWANKNLDSVQFFAPGPIPGTRFFKKMNGENRILTKDWFLYDGHHVIIRPKNFTPYEHQKELYNMSNSFYRLNSANSIRENFNRFIGSCNKKVALGVIIHTNFLGGISKISKSRQYKKHLEFLKSVS